MDQFPELDDEGIAGRLKNGDVEIDIRQ